MPDLPLTDGYNGRALLLTARNLGDAAIAASFLGHAERDMPEISWHVLCRPQVAFLFEHLPNVEAVITAQFPMGTRKRFGPRAALELLRKLAGMRGMRYLLSVDLVGDVREVTLGRLITGGKHYSPEWPAGHPFIRMHYQPIWPLRSRVVKISDGVRNVYAAYKLFSTGLATLLLVHRDGAAGRETSADAEAAAMAIPKKRSEPRKVGLHPLASQDCKLWRPESWQALIRSLISRGHGVALFGAPEERSRLLALSAGLLEEDRVHTDEMPQFISRLRNLDLLIGLDSFSVHAAHLCRVPAIMINGSNDSTLFNPPGVAVLSVKVSCGSQPCLNVPRCVGAAYQYACTRDVSVMDVLNAAESILMRDRRPAAK